MTAEALKSGTIVGDGACPNCGAPAVVKVNRKGHLYVFCTSAADGGCNSGIQSRSDRGDSLIARRVHKWRKPEYRARFLAASSTPTGGPELEPIKSEPKAEPAPAKPEPKSAGAWWEKPLW